MQLRRDALPALEAANVGLAVVGIGSLDAGETFASRTEFPKSMLYVDDSDESEAYRAAGTRNTKRKPDGKADFEGIGSMWSQATNDALKERGKKDLDAITGSLFKPGKRQCVYAIAATHRHANRRHLHAAHAERLDDDPIHGKDDGPGRLLRLRGRRRLRQCPSP